MSTTYNIIFRGKILPGHDLAQVKAKIGQLFKLDDAKVEIVFSGKPVALKKGCDVEATKKLRAVLTKVGAEIEIMTSDGKLVKSSAAKPAAGQPACG